jgi:hypothetical protein
VVRRRGRHVLRRTLRTSAARPAFSIRTSCFRPGNYRYRITTYGSEGGRKTRGGSFRIGRCQLYFPSRCFNARRKPRHIIVACGDGNFQLRSLRWNGWDRQAARASGLAWINDCVPYCAAGSFHYVPVHVTLTRRRWCGNIGRFFYTRLSYRMSQSPPGGGRRTGRVRFGCGWIGAF